MKGLLDGRLELKDHRWQEQRPMIKLAGFADEISPDLDLQISVCKKLGIADLELRSVAGKNVLDFDGALRNEIRSKLADAGMRVAVIGSPIGKVKIDEPFVPHMDRFKIAVETAAFFSSDLIRIFSYYPPEGGDISQHRDEVMRRFFLKVEYIGDSKMTLLHENERHIFGEGGKNCLDLMKTIDSPKLASAFDFANFVQAGEDPLLNWPMLKPFTRHIHIKDARKDGSVVPAGEGDGNLGPILKDAFASGYRGFFSLEPHLAAQGKFSGFSGPELFTKATLALRALCEKNQIPLA